MQMLVWILWEEFEGGSCGIKRTPFGVRSYGFKSYFSTYCVNLDKLLNPSEPQFLSSHMSNRNNVYHAGLW